MVLGSTHHKIMPWPLGGSTEMPIDFEYCLKNLIRWLYPGINRMVRGFWSGRELKIRSMDPWLYQVKKRNNQELDARTCLMLLYDQYLIEYFVINQSQKKLDEENVFRRNFEWINATFEEYFQELTASE